MENIERKLKYIALTQVKNIGPVKANKLLEKHDIANLDIISEESLYLANDIWEKCYNLGITICTVEDDEYPDRLRFLLDRPIVLYSLGNQKINDIQRSVGVVGARRCTREGKDKAIEITQKETERGAAIVSGMAKGIDSYAHTAAIKSRAYTVAVLGCGADICYPAEHQSLYDEIINSGCIISEYPPGIKPRRYMFPARNRIIAGLSDTVYVVDVGWHSGAESTVNYSRKYGRQVVQTDAYLQV